MSAPRAPFPDWLAHRAAAAPHALALVADGRRRTYAELDADATDAARRLRTLGAGARTRVATLLHNGADAAVLAHAAGRAGATLVPLNPRLADAELAAQLADVGPAVLVAHAATAAQALRLRERVRPAALVAAGGAAGGAAGLPALADVPPSDAPLRLAHPHDAVHTIVHSSGTTGRAKGAMLTYGNHWWSALGSALNLGAGPDDHWLAVLPLFHVGGQAMLLRAAIGGGAVTVHERFDADAANDALDAGGITRCSLVAVMLQRLLDARGDRPFPPALRAVLLGGGPAPRPLLERCARLGAPVVQTYGLTETASQVATLAPADALAHLGAAGRALYPNALRIAAPDGAPLPPDTPGEIQVRGPVVFAGYWARPGASARALAGGWLRTGDVGTLDAGGVLRVLDRRDDLIVSGGENVYPAEVEAALLAHPDVLEAGVIGVPDDAWGQRVVAVVHPRPGTAPDAAALRAHCRTLVAGYKVPAELRLAAAPLPRTASGKLRRAALRAGWAVMRDA